MTIAITNYTTYDLAYYYADLRRLPCLSRDERQHLLTNLSQADAARAALPESRFRQQLMESYLPLAKHLPLRSARPHFTAACCLS